MKNIDTLIFDMDDTLYPASLGHDKKIEANQKTLMLTDKKYEFGSENFSIEDYMKYGFDVLRRQKNFNWDGCLQFVCNRDMSDINANPELKKILNDINHKKIIFTNSHPKQMGEILERMDLTDSFDLKIDPSNLNFYFKPELKSFELFFEKTNVNPKTSAFFEDNMKNLAVAKKLGMTTVLISEKGEKPEYCDYSFKDIVSALNGIKGRLR